MVYGTYQIQRQEANTNQPSLAVVLPVSPWEEVEVEVVEVPRVWSSFSPARVLFSGFSVVDTGPP